MQGGADPNTEDEGGQKPIHAAAAEQHRDIVELLLPLTAPDDDSSAEWTVDGIIQEAQQSIADDHPVEQQHQVRPHTHAATTVVSMSVQSLPCRCLCFAAKADTVCTNSMSS